MVGDHSYMFQVVSIWLQVTGYKSQNTSGSKREQAITIQNFLGLTPDTKHVTVARPRGAFAPKNELNIFPKVVYNDFIIWVSIVSMFLNMA